MAVRDTSNMPDLQVPQWVRLKREEDRKRARRRQEFIEDERAKRVPPLTTRVLFIFP